MKAFLTKVPAFAREEDGVALTEYLILLGLLVGGVIVSVSTIGDQLGIYWGEWATYFTNTDMGT